MARWLYKLKEDFSYKSELTICWLKDSKFCDRLEFYDEKNKLRLVITKDGTITVKKDYAWDGCSPKLSVLDLFWIGTPDGIIDSETGFSVTYFSSLVHDALGQFAKEETMPFDRQKRDLIFYEMLEGFKLRQVYYWAVRIFGSFYSAVVGGRK
jgi:hypothetical protein